MKMRNIALWMLAAMIILMAGCKAAEPDLPRTTIDLRQFASIQTDAYMEPEKKAYPVNTDKISLSIHNKGNEQVVYGTPYQMEVEKQGQWYTLAFKEGVAFYEIALILEPGASNPEEILLKDLDYAFKPGKYRILKQIFLPDEKTTWLSAEFTLE